MADSNLTSTERMNPAVSVADVARLLNVAEVAIPRRLFRAILERIRQFRLPEAVPG